MSETVHQIDIKQIQQKQLEILVYFRDFCRENGLEHENVVYIGDDYGYGGNDESVYVSDFPYLTIDDYRLFPETVSVLL